MRIGRAVGILLGLVVLAGGCAPASITLQPGPTEWGAAEPAGAHPWSLWVAEVTDKRSTAAAEGAKVGLLYPKFQREPKTVYVDPEPARYVRDELSRFLLHRGLAASEARRAQLLLHLDLTGFSLMEKPGSVLDELTVRVEYTVRFVTPRGEELGRLRLEGTSIFQTLVSAGRRAAEGFRDALADTFPTLLKSDVFDRVMHQIP